VEDPGGSERSDRVALSDGHAQVARMASSAPGVSVRSSHLESCRRGGKDGVHVT
jgi:hypothetical protein